MIDQAEPIYPFPHSRDAAIRWADRHHFDKPKRAATILRLALIEIQADINGEVEAIRASNDRVVAALEELRQQVFRLDG